jgi:hypothetical protein
MNKENITDAMESYLSLIKADYKRFHENTMSTDEIAERMIAKFNDSISYTVGKKYIKVVSSGSVHSFILKSDSDKFSNGDILKAASWNAPARNFARGNVFDPASMMNVRWTGA